LYDLSKYADDNKIFVVVQDDNDRWRLQKDLDRVVRWSARWGFNLNVEKCSVIQFGGGTPWTFQLDGKVLKHSPMEKDLGVLITEDLRWDNQVRAATAKARGTAHSLSRALVSKDARTWASLYRTFVRPHIEYASSAWIPHLASHLTTLGTVQRWFTRQIPGIGRLNQDERESECGLEPVASRIRRGIVIETFKSKAGFSGVQYDMLQPIAHEYDTRGREAGNFTHVKPKKDVRKFSFSAIAPILWDDVNAETRSARSVNGFKNGYDRMNISKIRPRNTLL